MSELFDAAKKLRQKKDSEDAKRRARIYSLEQGRRKEFESLAPMVVRALSDIGKAFYGGGLFGPKYKIRTIRYGEEPIESHVGWHLLPSGASNPNHARISVALEGAKFRITVGGNCGAKTYSFSLSEPHLASALKRKLHLLPGR
jgi:hypothetical protein